MARSYPGWANSANKWLKERIDRMKDSRDKLDYGNNQPSGGTDQNRGEVNPSETTGGTENANRNNQTGVQKKPLGDDASD